jgi:hypothetical protein
VHKNQREMGQIEKSYSDEEIHENGYKNGFATQHNSNGHKIINGYNILHKSDCKEHVS